MTEPADNFPADHLIERAAAMLRAANVARLPEQGRAEPPPPPPRPAMSFPAITGLAPLPVPASRQIPVEQNPAAPAAIQPSVPQPVAERPVAPQPPPAPQSSPAVTLEALERAGMVVARTKRTRISEEYRIVIGRVLRALHDEATLGAQADTVARNVVLITSARPGEGKSFTALNLAGSIAQNAGNQVILVDVDPKIRPISDQLGLGQHKGFLDLMVDPSLRIEDYVLSTALPNLSILPLGTRPGTRSLTSTDDSTALHPIAPAIHILAQRYPKSLIMFDTPPCLSTSDSHTMAGHVGQVVMVVEAERTQRSEVEAAIDLVRVCPTITMLLNKVRLTTSHTFGAYDYFGTYT